MDWKKALEQYAPFKELVARVERIPELERRVAELERKLTAPPCPRCRLPTWHVARSEPDRTFAEVGGIRRTYRCESCGFEEAHVDL